MTGTYLPPQKVWQIFSKLLPLSMYSINSHVQIARAKVWQNFAKRFAVAIASHLPVIWLFLSDI
jgi:hypothetical protein